MPWRMCSCCRHACLSKGASPITACCNCSTSSLGSGCPSTCSAELRQLSAAATLLGRGGNGCLLLVLLLLPLASPTLPTALSKAHRAGQSVMSDCTLIGNATMNN